jgi:hypothetical protein
VAACVEPCRNTYYLRRGLALPQSVRYRQRRKAALRKPAVRPHSQALRHYHLSSGQPQAQGRVEPDTTYVNDPDGSYRWIAVVLAERAFYELFIAIYSSDQGRQHLADAQIRALTCDIAAC